MAFEVAASLALLIGAGLLLRSFQEVLAQDRGFVSEGRVLAEVALPESYEPEHTNQFLAALRARLLASPEITTMAVVSRRPLSVGTGMGFAAADQPEPDSKEVPWASWRIITKDYFRALGVPLIAGRDFSEQDLVAKPWRVIISKRIAERLWPGENAVGRQLILWKGQNNNSAEVIGVAGDMRDWSLQDEPSLAVYLPYYGAGASTIQLVLQTRAEPAVTQQLLRRTLAELDASLPLSRVESLETVVSDSVASRRFVMMLLATFASVVLVAHGMLPVAVGVVAGVGAAIGLTRLMASLLFGVSATDLLTYAGVAALLGAAALVSCYVPARQALKVDVVAALRKE